MTAKTTESTGQRQNPADHEHAWQGWELLCWFLLCCMCSKKNDTMHFGNQFFGLASNVIFLFHLFVVQYLLFQRAYAGWSQWLKVNMMIIGGGMAYTFLKIKDAGTMETTLWTVCAQLAPKFNLIMLQYVQGASSRRAKPIDFSRVRICTAVFWFETIDFSPPTVFTDLFQHSQDGMTIGSSLYDEEGAKIVPDILAKASQASRSVKDVKGLCQKMYQGWLNASADSHAHPEIRLRSLALRSFCQWTSLAPPSSERMAKSKKAGRRNMDEPWWTNQHTRGIPLATLWPRANGIVP